MQDAIARWRTAGEAGDAHEAAVTLADDVELISPLTDQFRFRGRDEVEQLLTSVFEVVREIRYISAREDEGGATLHAVGRIDELRLEESQLIDLGVDGRISRIALTMRPLPAVTRLLWRLGPRVAEQQGRPGVAAVLGLAGGFLDMVAASGDQLFVPLADPRRVGLGRDRPWSRTDGGSGPARGR